MVQLRRRRFSKPSPAFLGATWTGDDTIVYSAGRSLQRTSAGGGGVPERLTEEMPELVVNPWRPGRFEPRVRKRRPKQYPVMEGPRAELRKRLREKDLAA